MRIAFLSDIHANLPALEAALGVADRLGAQEVIVAGDLVGDGPHPVEVVGALRARGAQCIRGNVDRQVAKMARGRRKLGKVLRNRRKQKSNRAWTAVQLRDAPEELEWLAALPPELRLHPGEREVLVVHGSPRAETDYVYPSLTPAALAAKLAPLTGPRPDVLVCGHSHIPFTREVDGVLVINCGSVGRPADGDPRGTLAVVDFAAGDRPQAQMVRFGYPVETTLAEIAAREVPGIDPEEYRLGIKT